ncbi:hypothetical protein KDA_58700 [Dictyobacter alpinus]|uniref:non-specific serine/threonine protein kinase n=1 Tax=Dictyobacter alpinus TaxID=2014873 RepID=A0A402BGB1_9CHLR|nr:WD40 repeat domain-containing serine/threonine protein kinase [Dictyobacter alpinus]GCE30386.1 hypothetical protein KDA_58700 [Dictyobacter alpinus]
MRYCLYCGAVNADQDSMCFACARPLTGPLELDTTESLLQNRYRLLTQIGSGGFGAVYRAVDTQSQDTIVAIKQIHLSGLSPQQVIEATDGFNRELHLLSDLVHSHVPTIYDHFTDQEHWYLVMQFIEGETLEAYLHNNWSAGASHTRTLPLDEVLDLAVQLCDVLDYLHKRQPAIIYRDLKPANIMRTPQGELYLIDFGIARLYKPGQVKDTIPFGSPGYAAPEQYGKAQTTPRADIYSLGALLHQFLSGIDPSLNPFSFAPLRLYGQDGLAELETLILTMVELDASKRPTTIDVVSTQLQEIIQRRQQRSPLIRQVPLANQPNIASGGQNQQNYSSAYYVPGGQMQQQMAAQRKKTITRRGMMIGGVATLALIMGTDVVGWISHILDRDGNVSSRPALIMGPDRDNAAPTAAAQPSSPDDTWAFTTISTTAKQQVVRFSPDQQRFAALNQPATITFWRPGKAAAYELQRKVSVQSKGPLHTIEWSRDGSALLAATEREVYLLRLDQSQAMPLKLNVSVPIATVVWHPTETRFLIGGSDGSITVFATNNPDRLTGWKQVQHYAIKNAQASTGKGHFSNAAWSDDGRYIAAPSQGNEIYIWSTDTGELYNNVQIPLEDGQITYLDWYKGNNHVVMVGTTKGVVHLADFIRPGGSERLQLIPEVVVQDITQYLPYYQLFVATNNGLYVWYPMSGLKAWQQIEAVALPDNLQSITVAGEKKPTLLITTGENDIGILV